MRVLTINKSFELAPWADVLYAADYGFWRQYEAARKFKGWRYAAEDSVRYLDAGIYPVTIARDPKNGLRIDQMVKGPIGTVGNGGNSGFQAVNLAVQFGASRILLCLDYRGKHWHPDHPRTLRNPTDGQLRAWAATMDKQASLLASWGVEVVNVAPQSILRAYPHADSRLFDPNPGPLPA